MPAPAAARQELLVAQSALEEIRRIIATATSLRCPGPKGPLLTRSRCATSWRTRIPLASTMTPCARPATSGINRDTILSMAMTLRLEEQETEALRRCAAHEGRSMQEVARQAVREYIERTSRRELLDEVLDGELPRYAEALERLGR